MREQDDLLGQFAGVLRCCCPTNRFARTLSLRRCRLGRAFVSGDEYRWWMGGRTSCRSVVDGVLTGFSACGALVLPEPHIRTGYRRVANALRLITAGLWRAFRVRIGLSGFVSGFQGSYQAFRVRIRLSGFVSGFQGSYRASLV